ncbi:hypothetical protein HRbin29_01862 [bacterium HR29]|nr:hypothetical protein HRbin29_01862 [bacterium HR29]
MEAWRAYDSPEALAADRRRWEARGWRLADVTETELPPGLVERLLGRRRRRLQARYVRDGWPIDEWR